MSTSQKESGNQYDKISVGKSHVTAAELRSFLG